MLDALGSGRTILISFCVISCDKKREFAYLSTNVMLSAISATLFAILPAMMAYADCPPCPAFSPPATDAALFAAGLALCCAGRVAPLTVDFAAAGFLTGARGAAGFLGVAPLTDGRCTCVAILTAFLWFVSTTCALSNKVQGICGTVEVGVALLSNPGVIWTQTNTLPKCRFYKDGRKNTSQWCLKIIQPLLQEPLQASRR